MGYFNFHFENVENNNSRKLHDILDMFNLTQFVSEPTHNQGHLLDLVFSKQSYNIFISAKLHHGLASDHTAILCKLDISVPVQKPRTFSYRYLKKIDTGAFKQDLSHAVSQTSAISDCNNHLKTEALFFPFSSFLKPSTISLPDSITLGSRLLSITLHYSWLS